jgi:hypothetical protein
MFEKENVGFIGAEDKKERKKVIKMKDVFDIPSHRVNHYCKKEKVVEKKIKERKKELEKKKEIVKMDSQAAKLEKGTTNNMVKNSIIKNMTGKS